MDLVDRLIELALAEDVGPGDLTTEALVPADQEGRATFLCKERMVVAGLEPARRTFRAVDPRCEVRFFVEEGRVVEAGRVFGEVKGPTRAILTAERTALNFLQRLCGIATLTRSWVDALAGEKLRLLDTRKTVPGHRALEKEAVRAGGAMNHRLGLYDGVLIKDNHLAAVGSIEEAIARARGRAPALTKVEIEVRTAEEAERAAAAGADVILLDNMSDEEIAEAVKRVAGRALVEISGGVTLERLPRLARTGADFVSAGAITHQARAVDISLNLE
jgi:nicotinate-nucleotide pyrophosphorylase (carboxylating)